MNEKWVGKNAKRCNVWKIISGPKRSYKLRIAYKSMIMLGKKKDEKCNVFWKMHCMRIGIIFLRCQRGCYYIVELMCSKGEKTHFKKQPVPSHMHSHPPSPKHALDTVHNMYWIYIYILKQYGTINTNTKWHFPAITPEKYRKTGEQTVGALVC